MSVVGKSHQTRLEGTASAIHLGRLQQELRVVLDSNHAIRRLGRGDARPKTFEKVADLSDEGVAAAAFPRDTAPSATPVAVAPMNRLRPIRETLVSVAR
jgi:hypothetical protein